MTRVKCNSFVTDLPTLNRKRSKVAKFERQRQKWGVRERESRGEATARGVRGTRYKVQSNIDRAMQEPLASWWVPTCVSNAYHGVASRMHARPCLCFEGKRRRLRHSPPPSCPPLPSPPVLPPRQANQGIDRLRN